MSKNVRVHCVQSVVALSVLIVSLGAGCDGENAIVEDTVDAGDSYNVNMIGDVVEVIPVEPMLSYTVDWEGDEETVEANLGIRCAEEKPGQIYLSGTYLSAEAVTLGLRVGSPPADGSQVNITGFFEGQDAPEGEAIVSWNGQSGGGEKDVAGGWVTFTSLDPCEGEFRVEFTNAEGISTVLKDGVFVAPLELP